MANPRDEVNPSTGSIGANAMLNGEFYLNERTGRTHVRLPAGGAGGGVTSYADVPATEEQHVAFLKSQADAKHAEADALNERHEKAHEKLEKHRAKEAEEAKEREVTDESSGDDADVRNPITAETYGRPQMNPAGIDGAPKQHNPADGRNPADDQPRASPVKEHETV